MAVETSNIAGQYSNALLRCKARMHLPFDLDLIHLSTSSNVKRVKLVGAWLIGNYSRCVINVSEHIWAWNLMISG